LSEARCEKTDLLVTACGHCNGAEQRVLADSQRSTGPIRAAFPGICRSCGRRFREGSPISWDAEAEGYVAECCR
jgi:hypothetical protein